MKKLAPHFLFVYHGDRFLEARYPCIAQPPGEWSWSISRQKEMPTFPPKTVPERCLFGAFWIFVPTPTQLTLRSNRKIGNCSHVLKESGPSVLVAFLCPHHSSPASVRIHDAEVPRRL